ncbi:MAG: TasA family protein [Candidatus Nanopelagicales bacterium]
MDDLLEELDSFDRATPADRDRRRRFVATAAICGLAFVGIGQLATGALFEDSANASVTYTTGDVEIEAEGSASTTLPAASNLAPGDTVFRPVRITNVGSLDLRYAISGVTTSQTKSLATVLRYTIYRGVSVADCGNGVVGGGVALVSASPIGTTTSALVGDPAPGTQGGERTINAGDPADVLCVAMNLPLATTSTYAGANAQVTLTFDAEQTRNNP